MVMSRDYVSIYYQKSFVKRWVIHKYEKSAWFKLFSYETQNAMNNKLQGGEGSKTPIWIRVKYLLLL